MTRYLMWSFPLAFFGFQFILRLFPGLVLNEFIEKYDISAGDFGLFASLYYLGYAGMQMPMAMALDKWGTRKVLAVCALVCGLATCALALFSSWPTALISRFFIGAASVVGFLGTAKVITVWFAPQYYSRLIGLTFSIGLLGAIYGGRPISQWIANSGWESVSLTLGGIAMGLAVLSLLFLRDKPAVKAPEEASIPFLVAIKSLLTNRSLVMLAIANLLMVGALEGFADVWGTTYLMTARQLTKAQASSLVSYIFIGMLFGGPLLAYFSEKWKAYYGITMSCGLFMSFLILLILVANPFLSNTHIKMILFSVGVLCCYQVLIFTIGTQQVRTSLISPTLAFLNCINMLGGAFFHFLIGQMMDRLPHATADYGVENYAIALGIIPLASLIGALFVWQSKARLSVAVTS